MLDFKLCLSSVGTSFYFSDMHGAYLTNK